MWLRIKNDDTFIAQGTVDQSGLKHSREFDDLEVKSISDVGCLEVLNGVLLGSLKILMFTF